MFTIIKDFENLCISHQLEGLDEGHKCARLHGHNVTVRVIVAAPEVNEVGFVVDYGDLAPLKNMLWDTFDHRHLNDIVGFQPSAELMAKFIYDWCVTEQGWPVASVGWSETPQTWALYTSPSGIGKIAETNEEKMNRLLREAMEKQGPPRGYGVSEAQEPAR